MELIDARYEPKQNQKLNNLVQQYEHSINKLTEIESSERPSEVDVFGNHIYGYSTNMYSSYRGNNLYELYWTWVLSDVTTTIANVLKRKVFRGGFKISPITSEGDEDEERKIKSFLKKCNSDNQSYKEVLKEIYEDLNWADTGIQLNLKDYFLNSNKEIVGGQIREVMRINPINLREVKDHKEYKLGFENGRRVYTHISDRSVKTFEPIDKSTGLPNIPAHYIIFSQTGYKYYNSSEIIIQHKFKEKSGFSPLHASKNKILTLMEMDYYVKNEYGEGKPSKKMLAFKTQNRESMKEALDDYKQKVKQNPNQLYPLVVQSPPENRQPIAEVIDYMRPLSEMQYNEMRARYITDIGALWGTSPMFHNDMSTGGGLNNEGLQMTVTNEVVEDDKEKMEDSFIEETFSQLGLNIHYEVKLHPNREEDLAYKEDLFNKQLQNAKEYVGLGGSVNYKEGQFVFEEAEFSQDTMTQQEPSQFPQSNEQVNKQEKPEEVSLTEEITDYINAIEKETNGLTKR